MNRVVRRSSFVAALGAGSSLVAAPPFVERIRTLVSVLAFPGRGARYVHGGTNFQLEGIAMGVSRAVLILTAVLAHAAIANASTAAPDGKPEPMVSTAGSATSQAAAADESKAAAPRRQVRTAWFSKSDLRYCLERKSNEAIIRCAEGLE